MPGTLGVCCGLCVQNFHFPYPDNVTPTKQTHPLSIMQYTLNPTFYYSCHLIGKSDPVALSWLKTLPKAISIGSGVHRPPGLPFAGKSACQLADPAWTAPLSRSPFPATVTWPMQSHRHSLALSLEFSSPRCVSSPN